ncbi:MAG: carbohydrate ABC transporter permease [Micromonosporaceae bacterium]|nr:carbohydrate ABC transporter permease [Micromonosporaceae bacterium]
MRSATARMGRLAITLALTIVAISAVYPLLFMLITSLKSHGDYIRSPISLPAHWTNLDNYTAMFNRFDVGRLYANSVIYVAAAWLICLAVSLPAAFAFAKLEFPGRRLLFVALICSLAIPTVTFIIPDYVLLADLGIIDSPISVILLWSATGTPGTVFLLAAFMRSLPSEVIDAAAVDGAGYFQTMRRVILPMSLPAIVTVTIFDVTGWWNDLLTPLVFLQSESQATITLGVATIVTRYQSDLPLLIAGLVMAALPPIAVYVVAQRYIRRGLVLGAVQ